MKSLALATLVLAFPLGSAVFGQDPPITRATLERTVDLNIGETVEVKLSDRSSATVKVVDLDEQRDTIRGAVRKATVKVEVNGETVTLVSSNYRLPRTIGEVQIDCPVTRGYLKNSTREVWGLDKDVRLRLWPAGCPWIEPGTFLYPARQRWFAAMTQMANEPVYVDGGERPDTPKIYYHYGLDIGGAEDLVEIVAATDGMVVSSGKAILPGFEKSPASPRYDVVYLVDERGWYYRYSHLVTIEKEIKPGARVKMGQKVGVLGKEGGSGGWTHLHFDITAKQPSGKWGIHDGYAFLWQAYQKEHQPKLIAVARPHVVSWTGEPVTLDASRSWAKSKIVKYEWTFGDGTTATGPNPKRTYAKPGSYSEILKIMDEDDNVDYDFAIVQVLEKGAKTLPPTIHAAYYPTFGIKPGDPVTFKVRTFRTTEGSEIWDFGDGSPKVKVQSDGNVKPLAKDGYAVTTHRFKAPGHYLVRVERTNDRGETATVHLHVLVEKGR